MTPECLLVSLYVILVPVIEIYILCYLLDKETLCNDLKIKYKCLILKLLNVSVQKWYFRRLSKSHVKFSINYCNIIKSFYIHWVLNWISLVPLRLIWKVMHDKLLYYIEISIETLFIIVWCVANFYVNDMSQFIQVNSRSSTLKDCGDIYLKSCRFKWIKL